MAFVNATVKGASAGMLPAGADMDSVRNHAPAQASATRMIVTIRATTKQARTQPKLPAGKVRTLEPGALGMGRAAPGRRGGVERA
mgnify:CR=1 FL=1